MSPLTRDEVIELIANTSVLNRRLVGAMVDRALAVGMDLDSVIMAHNLGGPNCIILSTYASQVERVMWIQPYGWTTQGWPE